MAQVPQIALPGGVRPTTFNAGKPHRTEVFADIQATTEALVMLSRTVGYISDESLLFMSFAWLFIGFAFLLVAIENHGSGLVHWSVGTPDQTGAPNQT